LTVAYIGGTRTGPSSFGLSAFVFLAGNNGNSERDLAGAESVVSLGIELVGVFGAGLGLGFDFGGKGSASGGSAV
jgi:hypothetical protein